MEDESPTITVRYTNLAAYYGPDDTIVDKYGNLIGRITERLSDGTLLVTIDKFQPPSPNDLNPPRS